MDDWVQDWSYSSALASLGFWLHHRYDNIIMGAMASEMISLTIVYSTVYSGADLRKHELRVTGLCAGNSPGTGEFPTQMASNAEYVIIWWRHHDSPCSLVYWANNTIGARSLSPKYNNMNSRSRDGLNSTVSTLVFWKGDMCFCIIFHINHCGYIKLYTADKKRCMLESIAVLDYLDTSILYPVFI